MCPIEAAPGIGRSPLSPRAFGATALGKPSFAASLSRAGVWATGRIAPESPTSPK